MARRPHDTLEHLMEKLVIVTRHRTTWVYKGRLNEGDTETLKDDDWEVQTTYGYKEFEDLIDDDNGYDDSGDGEFQYGHCRCCRYHGYFTIVTSLN